MKIAVVGAGISGLAAAWHLSRTHEVVLFEALSRIGGHAHTRDVPVAGSGTAFAPVDTGFIVYNARSYPNLIALFDHLEVPTAATEMSFAVSLGNGALEYSGSVLGGLFGQRRNLLRPSHWKMCRDLLRFFELAKSAPPSADCRLPLPGCPRLGSWLSVRLSETPLRAWCAGP
ncbi:MAG: FAD-dependent oxidoreductase, partial [Pseudomonadota bacterium]